MAGTENGNASFLSVCRRHARRCSVVGIKQRIPRQLRCWQPSVPVSARAPTDSACCRPREDVPRRSMTSLLAIGIASGLLAVGCTAPDRVQPTTPMKDSVSDRAWQILSAALAEPRAVALDNQGRGGLVHCVVDGQHYLGLYRGSACLGSINVPVVTDGDAADLYRRIEGRPHPQLTGEMSSRYFTFLHGDRIETEGERQLR